MTLNIRRRADNKFNLWREDFLLPEQIDDPHDIRASAWQVVAVCDTHEEAQALRTKMKEQR